MKKIVYGAITIASVAAVLALVTAGGRVRPPVADVFSGPPETTVFAGGCFWGLQTAFDELPGVIGTRVGYTGGTSSNPSYEQVVAGQTGHAEAVEVVFDPNLVSFEQLVRHFFARHRSTSDEPEESYRKRAYRSAIFVSGPEQREAAERIRAEVAAKHTGEKPVATQIEDAATFWEAEAYHQKYLAKCAH